MTLGLIFKSLAPFLSIVFSSVCFAVSPSDSAIQQSTQAILKKERAKAVKILSSALERKDLGKAQREKIKDALKISAEMFFSDRGQSLYESGRNLYLGSSPDAVAKLNEAQVLESGNSLVLWALVKAHLKQSQCDLADQEFQKIPPALANNHKLFKPLVAYCRKPSAETFGLVRTELEKQYELEAEFPETYYWMWKADPKMVDKALRYKRDCETQKMKLVKKFEEFPQLCHFLPEVLDLEELNEP